MNTETRRTQSSRRKIFWYERTNQRLCLYICHTALYPAIYYAVNTFFQGWNVEVYQETNSLTR
jgi:hypothetical protein